MQHKTTQARRPREYLAGALMVALGTVLEASSYRLGELTRMGSGYFPTILGVSLVLLGLIIPFAPGGDEEEKEETVWRDPALLVARARGMLCIVAGILAFMVLGEHAGLAPASFALVFIAALGDTSNSIMSAALLALAMTLLGIVIFHWALQLQIPLFRVG